jgi:hypothetical protein
MTSSGIESATLQLVTLCLNQVPPGIHSLVLVYTVESVSLFFLVILSLWFINLCLYSSIRFCADYIFSSFVISSFAIGSSLLLPVTGRQCLISADCILFVSLYVCTSSGNALRNCEGLSFPWGWCPYLCNRGHWRRVKPRIDYAQLFVSGKLVRLFMR